MDGQLEIFMDQDMNNSYYEDFDNINPDESISQVFGDEQSETDVTSSSVSRTSAVWEYFDRNPSYALGYNVCKMCSH
ncbi:64_t:CDS:1, partial [Entrophospora sp. SA101]